MLRDFPNQKPASLATLGNLSGPITNSATSPTITNSENPTSNMR
jgi:hypothetical protein